MVWDSVPGVGQCARCGTVCQVWDSVPVCQMWDSVPGVGQCARCGTVAQVRLYVCFFALLQINEPISYND